MPFDDDDDDDVKSKLTKEINEAFKKFDLLISPTVPILPFKIGEKITSCLSCSNCIICSNRILYHPQ